MDNERKRRKKKVVELWWLDIKKMVVLVVVSSMTINSRAERHCKLNAIIILQCSGNGRPLALHDWHLPLVCRNL